MALTKEVVIGNVVFVHDGDGNLDHLLVNATINVLEDGAEAGLPDILTSIAHPVEIALTPAITALYNAINAEIGGTPVPDIVEREKEKNRPKDVEPAEGDGDKKPKAEEDIPVD